MKVKMELVEDLINNSPLQYVHIDLMLNFDLMIQK